MDLGNIKIGDSLELHCYKHNGKINTVSDKITIIDIKDDYIVCGDNKTTITENDGSKHKTKEPAIIFFYKNRWFNVLAQLKHHGLYYYCNIASPVIIEDKTVKFIDYDLDLRIYPDNTYKILDKSEYEYHKKIMKYSEDLQKIITFKLKELIQRFNYKKIPFDVETIKTYEKKYNFYKSID
jgi:protein associated with RNAse G/E